MAAVIQDPVLIPAGEVKLEGALEIPEKAHAVVVFAHGSGSGRFSPRNRYVAEVLREAGFGTLLLDLLTPEDEGDPFDIPLLSERLGYAVSWARSTGKRIGLFGASTGAAAALIAAADDVEIGAVVSRGGRPDLAEDDLPRVAAPTMFIVGGHDHPVLDWNREAFQLLKCAKELVVIPGATHLFEEPGALEEVARHAARWFTEHL